MEVLRAGELLVKQTQRFTSVLHSNAYRPASSQIVSSSSQRKTLLLSQSRSLTWSSIRRSENTEKVGSDSSARPSSTPPSITSSSKTPKRATEELNDLIDRDLDYERSGSVTTSSPGTGSPTETSHIRLQNTRVPRRHVPSQRSSTQDLLDAIPGLRPTRASPPNNPRRSTATSNSKKDEFDYFAAFGLKDGTHNNNNNPSSDDPFGYLPTSLDPALSRPAPTSAEPLPFKLTASVGRTVRVHAERGMDVGRAFRQLEAVCQRNRVRQTSLRQRFHERPGLRRKRLKSERWRRRFKAGFVAVVQKVKKLKKQGW